MEAQPLLDLGELQYFDPCGAVAIACIGERIGLIPQSRLIWPKSSRTNTYMEWIGLSRILSRSFGVGAPLVGAARYAGVIEGQQTYGPGVFPLQRFDLNVPFQERWLATVVTGTLARPSVLRSVVWTSAIELAKNAYEHSRAASVYVAALRQRGGSGEDDWLQVAIGDTGVGIPATIGARYDSVVNDRHALALAMTPGVSSTGIPGRGMGLAIVSNYTKSYMGMLTIRSGYGRFDIQGRQERPRLISGPPLTGTFIFIRVPTSPPIPHSDIAT